MMSETNRVDSKDSRTPGVLRKFILLSFCLVLILSLCSCGKASAPIEYKPDDVKTVASHILQIYDGMTNEDAEKFLNLDEEDLSRLQNSLDASGINVDAAVFSAGVDSFISAREQIGKITDINFDQAAISSDEETITCVIPLIGDKKRADGSVLSASFEMMLTKRLKMTNLVANVERTTGEKMVNAALNTVLGMGTTFCVLILISLVISAMSIVPKILDSMKKKEEPAEEPVSAAAPEPAAAAQTETVAVPEADDKELIAVIAAAIAAYESEERGVYVSPDTFIVRSLRRRLD